MERAQVQTILERLAPIYAELPEIACTGQCVDCCGPINWGAREARLAEQRTGKPATFVTHGQSIRCNYLSPEGRCEVYDMRPLICRMFGLVEKMKCPFGCVPTRWLTDAEATVFFKRIQPIVGEFLPIRGDVTAEKWVREAFERIAVAEADIMKRRALLAHEAEAPASSTGQAGFDSPEGHQDVPR